MAVASPERLRDDLSRLIHRGTGVRDFSHAATGILSRTVPFDGFCVLTIDPATLLPTGEVVDNGLPQHVYARMNELELRGRDFNAFTALSRSGRRAVSLSQATRGDLDRSVRHRELRRPNGFGDELRAALTDRSTTWGALTLLRRSDQPAFTEAETRLVASLSDHFAEGLRRAVLFAAVASEGASGGSPGLALVAADGSIAAADAAAEDWLEQLRQDGDSEPLPPVVTAVVNRARTAAGEGGPAARARVRSRTGQWLVIRGSSLGDDGAQTAVIIEPARSHELAPLIADAYGLTKRERVVTQLVAQGLTTNAIANRLHLSPWTVQDHLKAIFEKVGVGTRGELVARVFFEHYAPRLADAPEPIELDAAWPMP